MRLLVLRVESGAKPVNTPPLIAGDIGQTGFHVCNRKSYATTEMDNQTNLHLVAELLAVQ